ncbi:hypothetical protein QBC32DRAFT_331603 [Pseudoneurospora amorphoporcata]|uniref:Uncharacterized protein n=1 Tax=Pseudoneurospora amorphoporcata TaxID=241081 RepID=A0AAN6P1U0_9PEZI|nr:hypothetical protein QBC32DRAFT_331603 [Pseudoneurospora amorphoporcata]
MRGLKNTALFSALVLGSVVNGLEDVAPVLPVAVAAAVTVPNPQSLYIQFMHPTARSYGYGQDLGFRLDVKPSLTTGGCASPNVTVNNQPLLSPPSEDGSFVLDNDIKVHLTWESRCFPSSADVQDIDLDNDSAISTDSVPSDHSNRNGDVGHVHSRQRSQSVTLNVKSVDGQPVKEDLSCTIWFRQEEPVWAFGVAGWCVDARVRDVRGKAGGWEVVFDDDDDNNNLNLDNNVVGEGEEEEDGKRESREARLIRERKEFEKEVECLEFRRGVAEDQEETREVRHGHAQKPVISRESDAANRQRLETLCANLPPRANDTSTPSVHPPWQLPHHRLAKLARLPTFPGRFLDSPSASAQQKTLASLYASLRASIQAHLSILSPARLAAYLIFLSLPIFACVFHCLRRLRNRRRRLAQRNGHEPVVAGESLCPGFYGSDESCGECKAKYLAQVQAESGAGSGGSDGEYGGEQEGDAGVGEKTGEEQEKGEESLEELLEEKEEVSEEKEKSVEEKEELWSQERGQVSEEEVNKSEKERLSEQEYQRYREYHTVPEDGFALRYEPGSETQTLHEHVDQQVVDDDETGWDERETLVDSEDEQEKQRGDGVGESSGEDSGGEDSDDDLSIGGELASFMRAANLVEDMIRAGVRREEGPRPRTEVAPVNVRRQTPGTPPPPSYGEVVGLRGVVEDEGLPPRYEEYLRSRTRR